MKLGMALAALSLCATAHAATTSPRECPDLASKLETCTPYKCTFTHPFTHDKLERQIVSHKDGKCTYVEQMPHGGKMECVYPDAVLKPLAKYYRDVDAAKSVEANLHMSGGKSVSESKIDGKVVRNPLEEALRNGQCKFSMPKP